MAGSANLEPRSATAVRLMEAGMRLFADGGYAGTTVGDIEREAGLAPRSGALYQYFGGKEALLHAALEHELRAVDELASVVDMLPLGDLRAELTLLARWNLKSLARREVLRRFLLRESDRLPSQLKAKVYDAQVARPYAQIAEWLRTRLANAQSPRIDVDALAVLFIESMSGYWTLKSMFGEVPGNVDDERFVRAWVELALAAALDVASTPPDDAPKSRSSANAHPAE